MEGERITLTHNKDTDQMILSLLDDKDLLNACLLNNYTFHKVCDDDFFHRQLINKYPQTIQYKPPDVKWKKYYLQVIYWIDKMLTDYGFDYTSGNPKIYYDILSDRRTIGQKMKLAEEAGHKDLVDFFIKRARNRDPYFIRARNRGWRSGRIFHK